MELPKGNVESEKEKEIEGQQVDVKDQSSIGATSSQITKRISGETPQRSEGL